MTFQSVSNDVMVVFWRDKDVEKVLLWPDFQACLDNYVPLKHWAGQKRRAAYVKVDAHALIRFVVLFQIAFDAQGFIERNWNLPLVHMAEIAGPGPDLGYGSIQLACRSQCPVSWHTAQLWDPLLIEGVDEFAQMRAAVLVQFQRLGLKPLPLSAARESQSSLGEGSIKPSDSFNASPDKDMIRRLEQMELQLKVQDRETKERQTRVQFEQEQSLAIINAQRTKLLMQCKLLQQQNEALRTQVSALQVQTRHYQEAEVAWNRQKNEAELRYQAEMSRRIAEIEKNSAVQIELRQQSQAVQWEMERAHNKEMEAIYQERAHALQEQLQMQSEKMLELNRRAEHLNEHSAEQFLLRLRDLGMNFLVFHQGAGHISIPVEDLSAYVGDPVAYAARICFVDVDRYRVWLNHYQDPRCQAVLPDGTVCGVRIIRIDNPTRFAPGESDRCARHPSDRSIDAVLQFRPVEPSGRS